VTGTMSLRLEHISHSYHLGQHAFKVLDDVCFHLEPGERVAVVGPNGSGKSTLARIAQGLLVPEEGRVLADGAVGTDELCRRVGVVGQDPDDQIVSSSVQDEVAFGPGNLGLPVDEVRRRVDAAIDAMGLSAMRNRDPALLSGGERQRVVIAAVLAMHPAYVVLDEPTAMLDAPGRHEVLNAIAALVETGCGVVHITHDLDDVVLCDRMLVLASGRLVFEGAPRALLGDAEFLRERGLGPSRLLALAGYLAAAGVVLPDNPTHPRALAAALADHMKAVRPGCR
jgi:energy-coupling factor transport system ATP-binding protein